MIYIKPLQVFKEAKKDPHPNKALVVLITGAMLLAIIAQYSLWGITYPNAYLFFLYSLEFSLFWLIGIPLSAGILKLLKIEYDNKAYVECCALSFMPSLFPLLIYLTVQLATEVIPTQGWHTSYSIIIYEEEWKIPAILFIGGIAWAFMLLTRATRTVTRIKQQKATILWSISFLISGIAEFMISRCWG